MSENSELVNWSEEIVTSPAVAVRVIGRVLLFPTVTLPKFNDVGDRVNCGAPVPARASESTESSALLLSMNVPVTGPIAVGVKMIGRLTLLPGISVTGRAKLPK